MAYRKKRTYSRKPAKKRWSKPRARRYKAKPQEVVVRVEYANPATLPDPMASNRTPIVVQRKKTF